jgi:hypothetical protein
MATIKIKFYVAEIANVLANPFDYVQIQRSEAGSPYSDAKFITADTAQEPVLTSTNEGPFAALQGKTLKLKVNGGNEQTVTFTAADPISMANVVSEITAQTTGLTASEDADGKLQLEGNTAGTIGTLEITGGTGLTILGFTVGDKDNGEDQHVALQAGVNDYEYDDGSGEASYWYRFRYYYLAGQTFGGWSDWIQGTTGTAISAADLIIGKIKLADIDGTALVGAKITLVNVYNPLIADTYFIAGRSKQLETDGTGQAETTLIKGSTIDVIIEGTSFIRRILVPDTGTEFDLMDPTLVQDDPFQIQVPDLPAAVRRS